MNTGLKPKTQSQTALLGDVHDYWNRESCGAGLTDAPKHSRQYFEEIEEYRYLVEPEIFAFAQFTRHSGQKMLEVGVGAGTDFLQWCRAGTQAHGIDLTEEAIANVRERLAIYGQRAEELKVGNAESLPYPDGTFDLIYSWGVIHHSPDTEKAFCEIARVVRQGGTVKLMLYHRHSLVAFYLWVRYALLRGRPWRSLSDVVYHHMESIGTKAYTRAEIHDMARRNGLSVRKIDVTASPTYDLLAQYPRPLQMLAYLLASVLGYHRCGWYMRIEMTK
jgi:ubiquinone/menaquinone biosynthesis C-methylase UbiE